MFMFVAFRDSPTRLLSEFGHSTSPFLYVHIQSLCNVRTFHSLNYRSAAKAEQKVLLVLISCCIVVYTHSVLM